MSESGLMYLINTLKCQTAFNVCFVCRKSRALVRFRELSDPVGATVNPDVNQVSIATQNAT